MFRLKPLARQAVVVMGASSSPVRLLSRVVTGPPRLADTSEEARQASVGAG